MRLRVASKTLKGAMVRVRTPFETRAGIRFGVNEIVQVARTPWRAWLTVERPGTWPLEQGRAPVQYFELADNPGPPPARPATPAPQRRTWVRGELFIAHTGTVSVGGELLARQFAAFNGKRVRVTLQLED